MPWVETAADVARAAARPGRAARWLTPARYGLRRLRMHAPRAVVAAVGIAVGAGVLAVTQVASTAVQDRAVQQALAQLQPSDRAVQVVWAGVPAQSDLGYAQLDRLARATVAPILHAPSYRVAVYRQGTWGGAFVKLGAVDAVARWVSLDRGRIPTPCTPTRCELLQIGGKAVQPRLPGLDVVGRGTFRAGAPFDQYFGATGGKRPPILLANGVRGFV